MSRQLQEIRQSSFWDESQEKKTPLPRMSERFKLREGLHTGIPQLDALLHFGGLPRGRIIEISGELGSGCTSLAARFIAATQEYLGWVTYVRFNSTFDPLYGVYCGVQLDKLWDIHLEQYEQVFELVHDALKIATTPLMVVDLMDVHKPLVVPNRLIWPQDQEGDATIVVLRSHSYDDDLADSAWTRLGMERLAWIEQDGDIIGARSRVHILKNKPGHPGQFCDVDFSYNEFEAQ